MQTMDNKEAEQVIEDLLAQIAPLSDAEGHALRGLMTAFSRSGYLPDEEVEAALHRYLQTLGVAGLEVAPARTYVDHFFSMHPQSASFLFYKSSRSELSEEHRNAIVELIMDRLLLDLWPLPEVKDAGNIPPRNDSAEPEPRAFDEGDFQWFMSRFFGRDHVHRKDENELFALLANSRSALLAALEESPPAPEVRDEFLARYETSFELPIRQILDEVRSGTSDGGLFWIGR